MAMIGHLDRQRVERQSTKVAAPSGKRQAPRPRTIAVHLRAAVSPAGFPASTPPPDGPGDVGQAKHAGPALAGAVRRVPLGDGRH